MTGQQVYERAYDAVATVVGWTGAAAGIAGTATLWVVAAPLWVPTAAVALVIGPGAQLALELAEAAAAETAARREHERRALEAAA